MIFIYIFAWVTFGFIFTRWFVNDFLDDRKFSDQDHEVSNLQLLGLTFAAPLMAFVMALIYSVDWVAEHISGNREVLKRLYGMRKER